MGGRRGDCRPSGRRSLDEAKAYARARLTSYAEALKGREAPRMARVFEWETHDIRAEFRMTADGPLEWTK